MKQQITTLLSSLKDDLLRLKDDYYIIGASGLILHNIDVGTTSDIDILVSERDSETLKLLWKEYMEEEPDTKEDELFISNFARYRFTSLDIEVMGELKVKTNGVFKTLEILDYITIEIEDGFYVKIPSIEEYKRILLLFGREKDLKRRRLL